MQGESFKAEEVCTWGVARALERERRTVQAKKSKLFSRKSNFTLLLKYRPMSISAIICTKQKAAGTRFRYY